MTPPSCRYSLAPKDVIESQDKQDILSILSQIFVQCEKVKRSCPSFVQVTIKRLPLYSSPKLKTNNHSPGIISIQCKE